MGKKKEFPLFVIAGLPGIVFAVVATIVIVPPIIILCMLKSGDYPALNYGLVDAESVRDYSGMAEVDCGLYSVYLPEEAELSDGAAVVYRWDNSSFTSVSEVLDYGDNFYDILSDSGFSKEQWNDFFSEYSEKSADTLFDFYKMLYGLTWNDLSGYTYSDLMHFQTAATMKSSLVPESDTISLYVENDDIKGFLTRIDPSGKYVFNFFIGDELNVMRSVVITADSQTVQMIAASISVND